MIVIQNNIETSTQLIRIFEYFMSNFDEKCKKNRDNDQQITQNISKNKKSKKLNRIRQCQKLKKKHSFVKWKKKDIQKIQKNDMWKFDNHVKSKQICTKNNFFFKHAYRHWKKKRIIKKRSKKKLKKLKKVFFFSSFTTQMKNTINYQYFTLHYTNRITYEKIHNVITKSNSYKISNSSNIFNSILQLLMYEITSILLLLFNKCYDTKYCSKTFKNSITIILKKLKNIDSKKRSRDYQKSKLYRSITLLETFKKNIEIDNSSQNHVHNWKTHVAVWKSHEKTSMQINKARCTRVNKIHHYFMK